MKIVQIERLQETVREDYTLITFRTWWGKEFSEICITPNWNIGTDFASSGMSIGVSLWPVVKGFLNTSDKMHNYRRRPVNTLASLEQ